MSGEELAELVSAYGADAKDKLAGVGQPEANIRKPLENLLQSAADVLLGYKATFFDEVSEDDLGVRPDYAFAINGAITGYVEVKQPGHTLEPDNFTGHDLKQWKRQRDLPNLVYTNGTEFRLYRDGELAIEPVHLSGSLNTAGSALTAPVEFEVLLRTLFTWAPTPIRSVSRVVKAVAPLTRLLRESVLEQLRLEKLPGRPDNQKPFTGLARDWRGLLFPEASDEVFADGYAQTVAFALLLAQTEQIELQGQSLHTVGAQLGSKHSLMGRALQLLTEQVVGDFKVILDLLVRVVSVVDWERIQRGSRDEYLHLYEKFLAVYDPELQKESGSYYTPAEVVDEMVRLAEEALQTRLEIKDGFSDDRVWTIDPAMGTGTYLQSVIERVAARAEHEDGKGAVPEALTSLAKRLVGFEIQTGPFAVAELRLAQPFHEVNAEQPPDGLQLYVADTLDDPYTDEQVLASNLQAISSSRQEASRIKREADITVVIGNPPYSEQAEGKGGWIESGSQGGSSVPIDERVATIPLDSFRYPDNGRLEYVLKTLYAYFWRWGTWKVFDSSPDDRSGVVCFITTSGYLRGAGFKGMREYLRKTCTDGWIINVSPEGLRPAVNTRIFPGVQQTLAIGIFVRNVQEKQADEPATIRYREISGLREDKYEALANITLDDDGWRLTRTDWTSPFTPAATTDWDTFPSMTDLFVWTTPGVKANRTWVYAPSKQVLQQRWASLIAETDQAAKSAMFKEDDTSRLDKEKDPLPGFAGTSNGTILDETGDCPEPVPVFYRAFDRQYLIPDHRLLSRPRSDLWAARIPQQVFVVEQHSKILGAGVSLLFSNLIPDQDAFVAPGGGGSRVLPLFQPDGSVNLVDGLLEALASALDKKVSPQHFVCYLAGMTGHPAFYETFTDELNTPGIRVPLTTDFELFKAAVFLGGRTIWLQSMGEAKEYAPENEHFEFPPEDERRPKVLTAMEGMPPRDELYDSEAETLHLGTASFAPVSPEVAAYSVGDRNVIHSWLNYRAENPGGIKTSTLNEIIATSWSRNWTQDFLRLLTALTKLTEQHDDQAALLESVLKSDLLTLDSFEQRGIRTEYSNRDRKPKHPAPDESEMFGSL